MAHAHGGVLKEWGAEAVGVPNVRGTPGLLILTQSGRAEGISRRLHSPGGAAAISLGATVAASPPRRLASGRQEFSRKCFQCFQIIGFIVC